MSICDSRTLIPINFLLTPESFLHFRSHFRVDNFTCVRIYLTFIFCAQTTRSRYCAADSACPMARSPIAPFKCLCRLRKAQWWWRRASAASRRPPATRSTSASCAYRYSTSASASLPDKCAYYCFSVTGHYFFN